MKILTAEQIRALDKTTFDCSGLPSVVFMENAGRAVAEAIVEVYGSARSFTIVCGSGNNGGDGYVVARVLSGRGYSVTVVQVGGEPRSDAKLQHDAWLSWGGVVFKWGGSLPESDVVVDAIYGTGFHGTLRDEFAEAVAAINGSRTRAKVVSIDLPSGVNATTAEVGELAVQADLTVSLQQLKVGNVLFPAASLQGDLRVADIGLWPADSLLRDIKLELVTASEAALLVRRLAAGAMTDNKSDRGSVLVIGGSLGKYGAPQLSAQAALRSGAGLVSIALPESVARVVAPTVGEVMVEPLSEDLAGGFGVGAQAGLRELLLRLAGRRRRAIVVGPGLSVSEGASCVTEIIFNSDLPKVVDADALNILATNPRKLAGEVVLTPHPGEMARLVGRSVEDIERNRLSVALEAAERFGAVVVLKGPRTVVASPDGGCSVNLHATALLATAGSGDTLAGILGAFLARGLPAFEAAQLGTFIHGAAAEVCAAERGYSEVGGLIASDLASFIPTAIGQYVDYQRPTSSSPLMRVY